MDQEWKCRSRRRHAKKNQNKLTCRPDRVFFLANVVTSIFQKQICQRTLCSTLIKAIEPWRTEKSVTITTYISLDKLCHSLNDLMTLSFTNVLNRHIELTSDSNDDLIYLAPFHCCGGKTRRGRKKSILYRNGNLCILGGEFHPGKLNFCKFRPLV